MMLRGLAGRGGAALRSIARLGALTLALGVALVLPVWAGAATFTVNTISDGPPGPCDLEQCTLREAILAANAASGADTIRFLMAPGPKTITVGSALPAVTEQVTIDGTTQPGWIGPPILEITGSGIEAPGLRIAAANSVVRGLVINNFGSYGIWVEAADGVTITGNHVGTDLGGTIARPNGLGGVNVDRSSGLQIGTGSPVNRNVISGNTGPGVLVLGSDSFIRGNFIGIDGSGTIALGNDIGVHVTAGVASSVGNTIDLNVISGNRAEGVLFTTDETNANANHVLDENLIGTDAGGSEGVGNGSHGVSFGNAGGIGNGVIGEEDGGGNTIAFNGGDGIFVATGYVRNRFANNRIFSNAGLGIDLEPDGVTPNDGAPDGDVGANNLQNFPVLTGAVRDASGIPRVTGTLVSGPSSTFALDFYASAACDPSGNGEGARPIGSYIAITDGSGDAVFDTGDGFSSPLTGPVTVGELVTVTASDPTRNTSELSACFAVTGGGGGGPSFLVTTTADSGAGSLRAAIDAANATAGKDTISFAIPGAGVQTIDLASALPDVTDPVAIDGTTQPGYVTSPLVEVEGFGLGPGAPGLRLLAGDSTVRGLTVARFPGTGIVLGGIGGSVVEQSELRGNRDGVIAGSNGNTIGPQNTISGNGADGIVLSGSNNIVRNNIIGLDPLGSSLLANGSDGIEVLAPDNTIAQQNTISGNTNNGINVQPGVARTTIVGNFIGTGPNGTVDLGNGIAGITLERGSSTVVGAAGDVNRNVISGNRYGIVIEFPGATGNIVRGNFIGVDSSGAPLGNSGRGVWIVAANGNTIGGLAPGEGNVIAFNAGAGVEIVDPIATENRILGNSIQGNTGLAIDLGADGVTANDAGDADTGPNELQNFPVLTSVVENGANLVVSGDLDSTANSVYRLEFFAGSACDPSGNGEGATLLGSTSVNTTDGGDASFSVSVPVPVGGGNVVTATATDPDGNTSELSTCRQASQASDVEPITVPSECVPFDDGGRTVTFEEPGAGPVADRYAALGLRFLDDGTTTPTLSTATDRQTISPPTSLLNQPDDVDGDSSGIPLTILFDAPQTAVGFYVGNGFNDPPFPATITAFDASGAVLGAVPVAVTENDVLKFVGLRRELGGIRRVTLDFLTSGRSEEIDDLCFTGPASPPDPAGGLRVTVDTGSNPAGSETRRVALSAIPSEQLRAFSGAPSAGPVGSIPVGSIPVGSIPVGSIPVGSIPVGSIPVGSIPVGSIPVGSIPVGSIGLNAVPVGSIGLDQVLLSSLPVDWTPILVGTPLAGVVLTTETLKDVYANATARARFEALTLVQSGLVSSVLGSVPFSAILLGRKTLSQVPPPGSPTWCAAITAAGGSCNGVSANTNTVVGLAISGAPVGSIPVGSIPVGSIAGGIAGTPVGSIPVGSIDIRATRLADIRLSTIPNANAVVDCARISCTGTNTLGDAAALSPTAIRPGATLADLQAVLGNITLNELIIGIIPRSALAWEEFPIDGLQLFSGAPRRLRYQVDYDLDCARKAGLAITVKLPDGYIVAQGTSTLRYGIAAPTAGPNPTTNAKTGARWSALPDPCPAGLATQHIRLDFDAFSAFDLVVGTASASVAAGGTVTKAASQAPVLVTQNWEGNDTPDVAPTVQPDELVIGHIARAGDVEVFNTAVPAVPGTVTTFSLSHIGPGADFDLVIGTPGVPPLQSSPVGSIPVGSIPIEDRGSALENAGNALPPETLQDIPVGSIPVGSISANRGSENEVAEVVSRGEGGVYTIFVRGYNGSFSDEPFVLRVKRTQPPVLPPCPARALALGAPGVLPPGVAADRRALFLVNRSRMAALYGAQATTDMLAALQGMLERSEVKGAVLEIDGNAAVRAAYAAWDASPCAVERANDVVRSINSVVAGYRGSLPDLRYVVLLGTDDLLPMARVPDRVTISPERDFAVDLQFTTQNLTRSNPLYAAAALSYFLTDGAYGAFTRIEWLGRELFLPQVSVSRLVETPADIQAQVQQYVDSNGLLNPASALTTGYDFLTDGSQTVKAGLDQVVKGGTSTGLFDNWNRAALVAAFTGKTPPAEINSVNAHYSQWQLAPAVGQTAQDLVNTADVPAPGAGVEPAFVNRVQFTMGCHGGFNVPNTLLTGAALPPQALDWAETWARQRAAVYVANTGFGYGDTVANALSERLMSIFSGKLSQAKPIGEAFLAAQHDYFNSAGAYDVYDEKALVEATLYGLPFWTIQGGTAPAAPPPPPLGPDPVSGLQVASIAVSPVQTEHVTARGRFWDAAGKTQVTHYRPIQGRTDQDVSVPGTTAHGVIVKSLVTSDVNGVDPVLATPTIDLSAHEPERGFRNVAFPANVVNLTRSRQLGANRQSLVVNAGQFRPTEPPGTLGTQRLVQSIGVEVAYSTSADLTPPFIRQVGATLGAGSAAVFVDVTEPVRRVATMVFDGSTWRFLELSNVAGTSLWSSTISAAGPVQVFAMAQDAAGNVGYSTNKVLNYLSTADTAGPEIRIDSPLLETAYALNQRVVASYACSDPSGVRSCAGPVPSGGLVDTSTPGRKTFTVTSTDLGGRTTTKAVAYIVRYSFVGFLIPIKNPPKVNDWIGGVPAPMSFKLGGNRGLNVVASGYPQSREYKCGAEPEFETGTRASPFIPGGLLYIPHLGVYSYVWTTQKSWAGTCRQFILKLVDGTFHRANLKFKK